MGKTMFFLSIPEAERNGTEAGRCFPRLIALPKRRPSIWNSFSMKGLAALLLLSAAFPVFPAEYRTTNAAAILYDAPSLKGNRLFVIRAGTPVDLVVTLEGWSKVRDAEGSLTWIEKKYLSEKRTIIVVVPRAAIRQRADDASPLVFEAEKGVSLDLLGTSGIWANVRHRDGQTGFVRLNQIWGG
jgi:uncharacterized protein YgiM (DUF1202 family)